LHKILESQHEFENHIVGQFERAVLQGRVAVISELFDQLCTFVVLHHTAEETIMVDTHYPDLNTHQADHDRMRLRIFRLERKFREGSGSAADEALRLVRNWSAQHVSTADRKLAKYLADGEKPSPESPCGSHTATPKRLLLADDHKLVLEGLQRMLEPEFRVAGTVEDGRALLAAAKELRPDVILADISLPLLNGIDAARQLKKAVPESRVIFVTMHAERAYIVAAIDVGAAGYVPKHSRPQELLAAVRSVLDGQRYLAPGLGQDAENLWSTPQTRSAQTLTARQREVLQLTAEGKSNKEIASVLQISVKAVEFHRTSITRTLGTAKRADLTRYAVEQGLVSA